MVTLSAGFIGQFRGPLTWLGRCLMLVVGVLWIVPHWAWDLLALIGSAFVLFDRTRLYRRKSSTGALSGSA